MPDLRIKIEQDDSGKVEATVETFDVSANYNDAVTIYNDANAGGIAFKIYFPGESALETNPIPVPANTNYPTTVTANPGNTTYYKYIISANLSGGATIVIDPRFIIN